MTTLSQATLAPPEPATVVEQYGRLVSSICWRMTRDQDVAREAAQEVWVAVLEGLPRFRGDSALSTWIYTIARRVVGRYAQAQYTDSMRLLSAAYEAPGELAPPDAPIDHDLWVREMCDLCISGMLQCLEPDMRLALSAARGRGAGLRRRRRDPRGRAGRHPPDGVARAPKLHR